MASTSDPQEESPSLAVVGVAKKTRITKTKRSGLLFPVARVRNQMKAGLYAKIIQNGSAVYVAAVLEYVTAEVLELSGNVARQNKRHRINPRHINLAIRNDSELTTLLSDVVITQGGVVPHIQPVLQAKRPKRKSSSLTQSEEFTPKKAARMSSQDVMESD